MRPEDFFKSAEEVGDGMKEASVIRFAEMIVKKYFLGCVDERVLANIIKDPHIADGLRLQAVREASEGVLSCTFFTRERADIMTVLKKGLRHPLIKDFLERAEISGCEALVFPMEKLGPWVIHYKGESPECDRVPRVVIPGDGARLALQDIKSFAREYL